MNRFRDPLTQTLPEKVRDQQLLCSYTSWSTRCTCRFLITQSKINRFNNKYINLLSVRDTFCRRFVRGSADSCLIDIRRSVSRNATEPRDFSAVVGDDHRFTAAAAAAVAIFVVVGAEIIP